MKAYLARLNAEQGSPREIVGFFVAESRSQLYEMIDECCDADRVEILQLGPGGIYWGGSVDHVVPWPEGEKDDYAGLPGAASVCEWWLDALFNEKEGEWERIEFA